MEEFPSRGECSDGNMADRWMARFVPAVIAIAAGTFSSWLWLAEWNPALFNSLAVLPAITTG
jgi:cation transport ATPase